MAKKTSKTLQPKQIKTVTDTLPQLPNLPPEVEKKMKALKEKLDTLKSKVLDKFGDYIVGITLLPPEKKMPKDGEKAEEKKEEDEKKINILVVVDDTTSKKMSKDELYQKFSSIIKKQAEDVDKDIVTQSVLLTDIWQNCYDAKY